MPLTLLELTGVGAELSDVAELPTREAFARGSQLVGDRVMLMVVLGLGKGRRCGWLDERCCSRGSRRRFGGHEDWLLSSDSGLFFPNADQAVIHLLNVILPREERGVVTRRVVQGLFQRHGEFVNQILHQGELVEIGLDTQTMEVRIEGLKILGVGHGQVSVLPTYVALVVWISINVFEEVDHHYFTLEVIQIVISARLDMLGCLSSSPANYCRGHGSGSFVPIAVGREFIVDAGLSREPVRIHTVRELIGVRMFARAFLLRGFGRACSDRAAVNGLLLAIAGIAWTPT